MKEMNDLISRQAAINAPVRMVSEGIEWIPVYHVEQLPSVQPKRGYWTKSHEHIYMGNGVKEWTNWYCSECDAPNSSPTDFCPSCGADMRGEADG